ncbi:50S ribosomal protein L6 [Candidatus Micrarchaeota archaeon]|nr:50S ribosomal protein L6 [Candidatus Micrarchaeota archaeon]
MILELPSNVSVEVQGMRIAIKTPKGEATVKFNTRFTSVKKNEKGLEILPARKENRASKAAMNSFKKHIQNAIQGLETPFQKKMRIIFAHFPISIEVKGNEILVKNFLGEKVPRVAYIQGNTKVEIRGQEVIVSGNSKDDVGQTAANIRKSGRIRRKDERVFQDGIYYDE